MSLHEIDRVSKEWTNKDLERMLVFCMLDRAMPYVKVCKAFDQLDKYNLTTREGISKSNIKFISERLRESGFRFPNQTAEFLLEFSNNNIDIRTASRDELVKNITGIGYKLASMFLRNTRGCEYAVIDIHIKRFLKEKGYKFTNYKDMETIFKKIAKEMNMSVYDLDMTLWQERRIKLNDS